MTAITLGTAAGIRYLGTSGLDPLGGANVTTLVPGTHGVLWALVANREIFRIAGGRAERVARVEGPIAWCLLEHRGVLFVGTLKARLLRLDGDRLERVASFDDAPTREAWHQPGGRAPTTWSLACDGARLYANVHVGGILASSDGGETWEPTIDLHDDVHQVSVGRDGRVWAATGRKGLGESRDGGRSWAYHVAGLHATYLSAAVPAADGALVAASSGYARRDVVVYRFDGEKFAPCEGLPARFPRHVEARQLEARGDVAVVARSGGRVFVSDDAGRTWQTCADELPEVRAIAIG
jgi:hypothetical protein